MKNRNILLAAVLCLLIAAPAFALSNARMTVEPKVVDIDAFYNGSTLVATGSTPADSHVILRFVGATCDIPMKERGKVFGIMWMNLDSLVFRDVPSVCLVSSPLELDKLAGPEPSDKPSAIRALRLSGIEDTARIESNGLDRKTAFQELLKLKQGEGLYGETAGSVSYGPEIDGMKSFQARILIPSKLSPGTYLVELFAVTDGKIVSRTQEPITVRLVGFPAMLSRLAFGHAALYGVFATVTAILAGLAIGMVFQSKGAH